MRTTLPFRSLLLAASICAPVAAAYAQASTAELAAPASTLPGPVAEFKPTTLLKLGTGLTRQMVLGNSPGIIVPVVLGAEYQLAPAWAAYSNITGAWHLGQRPYFQEKNPGVLFTGMALDLGLRHYYNQARRQAKGRAAGPLVGNYLALESSNDFHRYNGRLLHESTGLTVLWGLQRRLGGHGLVDAYAGLGVKSLYWSSALPGAGLAPSVQIGVKISLVR